MNSAADSGTWDCIVVGAGPAGLNAALVLGRNDIARALGCRLRDDGSVAVDSEQATTVDRVYAAGNCAEPRALVPTAAGSGVTAAVAINVRLSFEDAGRAVADSGAHTIDGLEGASRRPLGT